MTTKASKPKKAEFTAGAAEKLKDDRINSRGVFAQIVRPRFGTYRAQIGLTDRQPDGDDPWDTLTLSVNHHGSESRDAIVLYFTPGDLTEFDHLLSVLDRVRREYVSVRGVQR